MSIHQNVHRLSPSQGEVSNAEQSGQSIIALLRQAADMAERNEERAKELAARLGEELDQTKQRMHELEEHLRRYHKRATNAEQWLIKIHDDIQEGLIHQLKRQDHSREPAVSGTRS